MTDVLRHGFVSPRGDGADPTQIQPSHWNTGHKFQGGAAGNVLVRDPTDATFGAKWGVPGLSNVYITSVTGTQHNFNPGLVTGGVHFIQWIGTADLTITGLAGGSAGQVAYFKNAGSANIYLVHGSASSLPANTLYNMATSAPMPLAPQGYAQFVHNGAVWVMVAHEQGQWIFPPFNASEYSGGGGMTWTLDVADVVDARYRLSGKTMQISLAVTTSTVGGTPGGDLRRVIPGGFSTALVVDGICHGLDNGVVVTPLIRASGTTLFFFRTLSAPPWSLSTNLTYLSAVHTFPVN